MSISQQTNEHHYESDFKEYLLSEYSNIAQAHFKTIETISSFFRNYLVMVAIPISLVATVVSIFAGTEILKAVLSVKFPLAIIFLAVSLAGVGVLLYIVNLRMDALLYARTINGIRKYFYDRSELDVGVKLHTRVLPQSPSQPAYHERAYFWPVIFSFAIFNSLYFLFALAGFTLKNDLVSNIPFWTLPATIVFFACHFPLYYGYAQHRETAYLKSYIIGVDIDGVLNEHREQFCKLLEKNANKTVKPGDISAIPVHECGSLGITAEDERLVFNDPEYWASMPVIKDAARNLERLRNSLKLKVFVFTHRPWPDTSKISVADKKNTLAKWRNLGITRKNPIIQVTKSWLQRNGVKYDRLIIEKGNEHVSDPQGHFRNRFFESRKRRIKYFVEDDLEKAIKLAYICEVVFLVDQPYNQFTGKLPGNLVRVRSWDEVYKQVRKLI